MVIKVELSYFMCMVSKIAAVELSLLVCMHVSINCTMLGMPIRIRSWRTVSVIQGVKFLSVEIE